MDHIDIAMFLWRNAIDLHLPQQREATILILRQVCTTGQSIGAPSSYQAPLTAKHPEIRPPPARSEHSTPQNPILPFSANRQHLLLSLFSTITSPTQHRPQPHRPTRTVHPGPHPILPHPSPQQSTHLRLRPHLSSPLRKLQQPPNPPQHHHRRPRLAQNN